MMWLISPEHYEDFADTLCEMHRLRYRVFKERLGWNVTGENGKEFDDFDKLSPIYLVQANFEGRTCGCVRLLPTTGPTMLRDVFPELLDGAQAPSSPSVWESSRFALDAVPASDRLDGGLAAATYELFAGMIEFGLSRSLTEIVTVTDVRMERILRRAGWPLRRIGAPKSIGSTLAVAGNLEISVQALTQIHRACGSRGRVLWAPVPIIHP